MRSIKEILASASPEVIKKLKEILESKDDNKLKEYLDSLIDKTSEKKVESKVKKEVKAFKFTSGNKVLAYFNAADYDWMRFKGKKAKCIPYNGMILKVEPEDVFGVAKVVDLYGNYKCIMPSYKRQMISLDPMIIGLIKARCRPFTGDVGTIMKACKERIPAKIVKAAAKDYNYYKKLANERVKEYNEILKGILDLKKFPKNTEFRKKIEEAFKTYIESVKEFCYQITDEMEKASKDDSIPVDTRSKVMTIVDYLLGHLDSEKELKTF